MKASAGCLCNYASETKHNIHTFKFPHFFHTCSANALSSGLSLASVRSPVDTMRKSNRPSSPWGVMIRT